MRTRPSFDEIAELSSCSKATVDRVLHGRPGVHPRTREKVNNAIAQLEAKYENGTPKPFATLSSQNSKRLGFIIQSGQAFTESFLTAIERQQKSDRQLQIEGLGTTSDEEVIEARRARHQRSDHRPCPAFPDELYGSLKGRAVVKGGSDHGGLF